MNTTIRLKTPQIINLSLDTFFQKTQQQNYFIPACQLTWKQKYLWVTQGKAVDNFTLPALTNQQWLTDCLQQSPVKLVCLDPELGETGIRYWADACQQANKKVGLRIRSNLQPRNFLCWQFKRFSDWLGAALLLLVLSPLMLAIALISLLTSSGPIFFRQWRVGERGRLFQIIKFRTMIVDAEKSHHQIMGKQTGLHKCKNDPRVTPFGNWLRKYSLDELPQLFNVLRGEMSLVGPRPWALYDALRLTSDKRKRLNALPGITGPWQVDSRSSLLDLDAVTHCDLDYLFHWSLFKDFVILLKTIPRVMSGFDAY